MTKKFNLWLTGIAATICAATQLYVGFDAQLTFLAAAHFTLFIIIIFLKELV